ncbi:MAG: MurR/RpiR family transcriptional regulator [Thermoflexaceae bacterium]|nr:MurR/RpiR family transcriptional regulator [Thermoflexaceae bacterium]
MLQEKDLLAVLKERMPDFSRGQRAIARYIISNYDKASYMTAAVLGKNAGVSESTVVRFATELGYEGYPRFQQAMASYVSSRLKLSKRLELATDNMNPDEAVDFVMGNDMENIKNAWENLDRRALNEAVDVMLSARKIYVVGIRGCSALAGLLVFYLNLITDNAVLVQGNGATELLEQMYRVGSEDVVIGISFPRYSMRTLKALEFANDRNARIITITDSKHSPLNLYSSCNLLAPSNMASVVDSFAAPISLINVLVVSLCMRSKEQVLTNVKTLEQVWSDYQLGDLDEIDLLNQENIKDFVK